MAFDNLKNAGPSSTQQIEPSQNSKEKLLLRSKAARQLFSAYPRNDYDDPETAIASYVEVLTDYSDGIVMHVTGNKTGIQRRSKFPPRVSELVAACDEAASILQQRKRYENWGKGNEPQITGPVADKPTYEQLQAKYGKDWGLDPTGGAVTRQPELAPSWDGVVAIWDKVVAMYQAQPGRILELANLLPKMRGEL